MIPSRREKIFKKIDPKLLQITPKLSEGDGSVIDLGEDSNSLEEGAKKLMSRFFKNQNLSDRKKSSFGNDLLSEVFSEDFTGTYEEFDDRDLEKPGGKWQILKVELLRKIEDKWEVGYWRRVKEYEERNKAETTETEEKDDESVSSECNKEEEEDEESIKNSDTDEGEFSGDEADNECDDETQLESECKVEETETKEDDRCSDTGQDFESDNCSLVPAYQPGGGLLFGGSELTQNDNGLPQNLLSPSLRLSMTQSSNSNRLSDFNDKNEMSFNNDEGKNTLFEVKKSFQNSQNSFDLDDAFEFCSGKFPDTQVSVKSQLNKKDTAETNEERENLTEVNEEEKEVLDSELSNDSKENEEERGDASDEETEDSKLQKQLPKLRKNIVIYEDSESDDNLEEFPSSQDIESNEVLVGNVLSDHDDDEEQSEGKRKNPKKKMRKNLHFSDDEDEDAEGGEEEEEEDKDECDINEENEKEEEGEDFDQRSVNYDSEENEVINPREYFEKEAELSGSEGWSGDEDERGLDEYDVEEGDADQLDSAKVKSQLEKIHLRRVLDDDIREVRRIQEILFEDGDLYDGKQREKKFRWKNLGTFENDESRALRSEDILESSSDEEGAEEELRKVRHQKALFLMDIKNRNTSDDEIIEESLQAVKVSYIKNSPKQCEGKTGENKLESSKGKPQVPSNSRGSFLKRNHQFLSRLAKVTSAAPDNVLGPKHSKNFIFAAKSPEKVEPVKKVAHKRQNEEAENLKQQEKKLKIISRNNENEPSIVDLLV